MGFNSAFKGLITRTMLRFQPIFAMKAYMEI